MAEHIELTNAVKILRAMGAKRVVLFGSAARSLERARDIDLAVEGIPLNRLLDADLAVNEALKCPTDLVSREEAPGFYEVATREGVVLYEER
jgi:predicted nucleotidyltransferase